MGERCVECEDVVDPAECFIVSWDDMEPLYICDDCCESALVDNYWAGIAAEDDEAGEEGR